MDNTRGQEGRKGQPHNTAGGRSRNQPPTGFEGMNYEQKRRPYLEGKSDKKTMNGPSSEKETQKRG